MANTYLWTNEKIKRAWLNKELAVVVGSGCVVRFLFLNGLDDGYLANTSGRVKRFKTDAQAATIADQIKNS